MSAAQIPDAADRRTAVHVFDRDLLVEAGAGSGKTSLLVERLLNAILAQGADLRRCAAITFTNKAAAELQDRLAEELEAFLEIAHDRRPTDLATAAGRLSRTWQDPSMLATAISRAEAWVNRLDEAVITTLHAFCGALLRRHPLSSRLAPDFREDDGQALERLIELEGPREIGATLAALPPSARRSLQAFSAAQLLQIAHAAVRQAPAPAPSTVHDEGEALALFAQRSAERLRALHQRRGWVSFEDLLLRTRDLLRDDEGVRQQERRRWDHLLVDELQDTDPRQYEILSRLSLDPKDDASPRPRLFLVGDPKQSIYRFRNADLTAYEAFCQHVLNEGRRLRLQCNFRSRSRLLEPINALFATTMQPEAGVQPPYEAILPAPANLDSDSSAVRVQLLSLPPAGDAESRRQGEAAAMVSVLQTYRSEGRAWNEFLILLPKLTGLPALQQALQVAGIPFTVDGGKAFYKRQEVADFTALLTACLGSEAGEEEAAALLAVMRSAIGGVRDAELWRYRRALGQRRFGSIPEDATSCPQVVATLQRLQVWKQALADLPEHEFPLRLLDLSELRTAWGVRKLGAQAVANLDKAAQTVSDSIRGLGLSLIEAVRRLADRLGQGEEADQGVSEENSDAVSILTVHKAKGLECEIVLLGGFDGGSLTPTRGIRVLVDEARGYGVRVDKDHTNALYDELEAEDRRHLAAEKLRLFYVALTRAREELWLFQSLHQARELRDNLWTEALQQAWGYSPDQPCPHVEGVRIEAWSECPLLERRSPPRDADFERTAAALREHRAERLRPAPLHDSPSRLGHEFDAEESAHADSAPATDEGALGRAVGTLTHRLFEHWDFRGFESLLPPPPEWLQAIVDEYGVDAKRALAETEALLATLPDSECGRHLLTLADCPKYREHALLHFEQERTFTGEIDLLYQRPDGSWVVADYKTDRDLEPAEAVRRYGEQLRLYGRAVAAALQLKEMPRLELLLLRSGAVVEVPPRIETR